MDNNHSELNACSNIVGKFAINKKIKPRSNALSYQYSQNHGLRLSLQKPPLDIIFRVSVRPKVDVLNLRVTPLNGKKPSVK